MNVFGLIKTTVVCALIAFFVYTIPVIGQIVIIGILALLWISCAHQTLRRVRQKRSA
jgi:uncharacterized membrane protein YesL